MISVILFITFGLNALLQAPLLAQANGASEALKELCNNKPVELRKLSQVIAIIEQLESAKLDCPQQVQEALIDLKQVISEGIQDVCSNEKVDQIRKYSLKHIQASEIYNGDGSIPGSLKKFFLAFGFKVSGLCKKNMINTLLYEARSFLSEKDFTTIEAWTGESSFLANIFRGPNDYDDLILASEVNQIYSGEKDGDSKLFLQTSTSSLIRKIQVTCDRRFKPIYSRLILPLVNLSNMGFNYQGEDLKYELEEMSTNKEIHRWYKIVYICDALSKINLVAVDDSQSEDMSVIHIMTEEEVRAMPSSDGALMKVDFDLEPVVYLPEGIPISDEIIDQEDDSIVKLVNTFKNQKTEADRIRSKLLRKVANLVKDSIMQGKLNIVGSMFKRDNSKSGDMNKNIIETIDEYIQQASNSDSPVMGVGNYAKRTYHNAVYLGPAGVGSKVLRSTIAKPAYGTIFWRVIATMLFITGIIMVCMG